MFGFDRVYVCKVHIHVCVHWYVGMLRCDLKNMYGSTAMCAVPGCLVSVLLNG